MWSVDGQEHILAQLEPSLRRGRLAHAYLLTGPPRVGKMTLAMDLARAVNCLEGPGVPCQECSQCRRITQELHADVRVIRVTQRDESGPTRTVIGIGDVREALRQTNLKPYEGASIVIIFDGAELMSEEAANALLKALEEPPPQVLILLLTTDADALLSTIRSRCRLLELKPVSKARIADKLAADLGADPELAQRLALLSRGCLGWAVNALHNPDVLEQREADMEQISEVCRAGLLQRFNYANELAGRFARDRTGVKDLLFLWLQWWRDVALIKEGCEQFAGNPDLLPQLRAQASGVSTRQVMDFLKSLHQTLEALDSNANPRLALEMMMLDLPTA
jgi:DNA polymerase-3 subunit delta'